jgi:REP element-mobilizing transposase RayT
MREKVMNLCGQVYECLTLRQSDSILACMDRPLRIECAGAVYHVTSRGNEKKPVFNDDTDRQNLLSTLQHVNKRYNWIYHAYCLMTNHYHFLIETPDDNLSLGMRRLNGVYSQLFMLKGIEELYQREDGFFLSHEHRQSTPQ